MGGVERLSGETWWGERGWDGAGFGELEGEGDDDHSDLPLR